MDMFVEWFDNGFIATNEVIVAIWEHTRIVLFCHNDFCNPAPYSSNWLGEESVAAPLMCCLFKMEAIVIETKFLANEIN